MAAPLATRIQVLGKEWTVWFLPEGEFRKRHGKNCLGATTLEDRRIDLRAKKLTFETTAHELGHAYLDELCLTPAELDGDALEEIFCDLLGRHGRRLMQQASEVLEAYLQLKGKAS